MVSRQAAEQLRTEELCSASVRALTGQPDLQLRSHRLFRGSSPIPMIAPHLYPATGRSSVDAFIAARGASDGMALRVRHCDPALHAAQLPKNEIERLVFDILEQFRVEALAAASMPGLVATLRQRHLAWSRDFQASGLMENDQGLLLYTVLQICRSRVTGEPVVEETEDLLENTRGSITSAIGSDLVGLRRQRENQSRYARHAQTIAAFVSDRVSTVIGDAQHRDERSRFVLFLDFDQYLDQDPGSGDARARDSTPGAPSSAYRIFSTSYDRQRLARDLVRPAQLQDYRDLLDRRIAQHGVNVGRLARDARAALARPGQDGWDSHLEAGQIDGRILSRLITSPADRRVFRADRTGPATDCLVTFLVDCSGSMKEYAESVPNLVDIFVRALDLAEVRTEVLGFTTGSWNGGRVLSDWNQAGRPPEPGRLNELSHLVFKDADRPWRQARGDIAALLSPHLYREGVDGEAVAWACDRMRGRTEQRRLLLVISDGSPMDSATSRANGEDYLDRHLAEVVSGEERLGTEIYGLGVGLDLSPYYRRSLILDLTDGLRYRSFADILALVAGDRVGQ